MTNMTGTVVAADRIGKPRAFQGLDHYLRWGMIMYGPAVVLTCILVGYYDKFPVGRIYFAVCQLLALHYAILTAG